MVPAGFVDGSSLWMPRAEPLAAAESTPLLSVGSPSASETGYRYGAAADASSEVPSLQQPGAGALSGAEAAGPPVDIGEHRRAGQKHPKGFSDIFSLRKLTVFLKIHGRFLAILALVELLILLWAVLKPEIRCQGQVRHC